MVIILFHLFRKKRKGGGKVDTEKVVYILQRYKDINRELQLHNRIIKDIEDNFYCPLTSSINKVDSTEKTALSVPVEISKELKDLQKQKGETLIFKTEVKRELDKLETLHKCIIYDFYIDHKRWEQIAQRLNYSVRQCKNIRAKALKILGRQFEYNKELKKFKVR